MKALWKSYQIELRLRRRLEQEEGVEIGDILVSTSGEGSTACHEWLSEYMRVLEISIFMTIWSGEHNSTPHTQLSTVLMSLTLNCRQEERLG